MEATVNKRLAMLETMTGGGSKEPFAWYGLAMEYKNVGRLEDAATTFRKLRELDPDYLATYLMAGQNAASLGDVSEAKTWLEQGLEVATRKGDEKARSELAQALEELEA